MQALAKLFGHGDYAVGPSSNSIIQGQAQASFSNNGRGLELTHREFISDVTGTTAFTNTDYPINPAMATTFPFLSQIAKLFEEYEFLGLVFEFITTSGVVSATSAALGSVIMATDYDSYAKNFASKQQMESYQFAISTVPCANSAHGVECNRADKTTRNLYTRTGAYQGSLLDYDFGKFQIATVGMPSTYVVGELWVTYHIRLLKPRLPKPLADQINFAMFDSYVSKSAANGRLSLLPNTNPLPYLVSGGTSSFFYDVSQTNSTWTGQPIGFNPGTRAWYILRKSTWEYIVGMRCTGTNRFIAYGTVTTTPGAAGAAPVVARDAFVTGANVVVSPAATSQIGDNQTPAVFSTNALSAVSLAAQEFVYKGRFASTKDWDGVSSPANWAVTHNSLWVLPILADNVGGNQTPMADTDYILDMEWIPLTGQFAINES